MLTDHRSEAAAVVFLLDVDNTLLDNDRFGADLASTLDAAFGETERKRYWAIYEELRQLTGFADYLGALQRFRSGLDSDPSLLQMSHYLLEYPFAERLYPYALETVAHLRSLGTTAILSDGDVVFQPRKIQRAGLWQALRGEVLVYVHKQQMLVGMQQRYPAAHYVMVDDKPHILADMKRQLGRKLTTVFVQQGHYAAAASSETINPAPDITIACIGDLRRRKLEDFLPTAPVIRLAAD
ncbi:HAD family hydrolase [Rhodanobacter sp. AS-Z3]|uniref:HAD family hydrolase n=1 Tax=Rhodanobacter sp. AS-Z3 TaxID=3031330 RepID=UPI002479C6B2|nr:HAD family hydrolase [Rhodanobacter sp. AS-Z3]WEN15460.1 HAD family hydrolase [Rhodanobacter sp. AS-Z3]